MVVSSRDRETLSNISVIALQPCERQQGTAAASGFCSFCVVVLEQCLEHLRLEATGVLCSMSDRTLSPLHMSLRLTTPEICRGARTGCGMCAHAVMRARGPGKSKSLR